MTDRTMEIKATPFSPSSQVGPPRPDLSSQTKARWRRPGFWSAIAGMAMAAAIACAVVALEMAGQSASHFQRLADHLQARLGRTEERLTVANLEVAQMRRQEAIREEFNRLVGAPDSHIIRLQAVDPALPVRGTLAFSSSQSQAILEVSGLPQTASSVPLVIHWIRHQGGAPPAAAVTADASGQAGVMIEVPPPPRDAVAVVVESVASTKADAKAVTTPILRGELHRAAGPVHGQQNSKH